MRYSYSTRHGKAEIVQTSRGWEVLFDGEALGTYASPHTAVEELSEGTCYWPSAGNPASFGISDDLSDWSQARF